MFSNDELPKNKKIYYSKSHLRPVLKSGNASSAVISIYDNTGDRSYAGYPLCAYTEMDECIKRFGEQVRDVIKVFEEKKRVAISEIEEKIKNLTGYL